MKGERTRSKKTKKQNVLISFLKPTKWTIIILLLLYFSNFISFLGLIVNYPIFYFYWNYKLDDFGSTVLLSAHIVYLYVLSAIIVKLLS